MVINDDCKGWVVSVSLLVSVISFALAARSFRRPASPMRALLAIGSGLFGVTAFGFALVTFGSRAVEDNEEYEYYGTMAVRLVMGMHNYSDRYGTLPAAYNVSPDGKPLLSWRVHILPFVEEGELYRKFRLDEPWDSEHNIALLPKMPIVFRSRASVWVAGNVYTNWHVFVGPTSVFPEEKGVQFPKDIPDGTGETILVVGGGPEVLWTKPDDIVFRSGVPLPNLCTIHNGFFVGMADGSRRFVDRTVGQDVVRAAITRDGGEHLGPEWWKGKK